MSADIDHSIRARGRASLIEHLIKYFDRHVAMLIDEGVPSNRIAEALRLTTVRVEILHGEGSGRDRQTSQSRRRFLISCSPPQGRHQMKSKCNTCT